MNRLNHAPGSPEATELRTKSKLRKLIKQEIHRAVAKQETKLKDVIENIQPLNEVDFENSIQKLEAQINTISKRAEAALSYIRRTEKKSPVLNVDIIRGNREDNAMEALETKSDKNITDCAATNGELLKMMETTENALKRIHMNKEALMAVMADPERPPPILSPEVSLEKMTFAVATREQSPPVLLPNGFLEWMEQKPIKQEPEGYQDTVNYNDKFEQSEPKVKRLKEEIFPPEPDSTPKIKEEWLYYPPLPATSFPSALSIEAASYSIPKKLDLKLAFIKNPTLLSVMWNVKEKEPSDPPMESYTILLTMEKAKGSGVFPNWYTYDKLEAKALPMCALIKKYKPGHKVCAAVVGRDMFGRYGPYSDVFTAVIPD
ncbi:activating transcription factor 7-interacting protein 2 [Melanotaenia boesemani]|uniref:activating transcription factor 7-interacting protein 2 n=1 Tax=Melanotaenia boesemani TaxID=1250792 RepID=UPI001C03BF88|nr:activating transcription factor 7-interacting protein 2 [Melanotaenia boesemani]